MAKPILPPVPLWPGTIRGWETLTTNQRGGWRGKQKRLDDPVFNALFRMRRNARYEYCGKYHDARRRWIVTVLLKDAKIHGIYDGLKRQYDRQHTGEQNGRRSLRQTTAKTRKSKNA